MVASDCSSFHCRMLKYCDRRIGHLRILFAYYNALVLWVSPFPLHRFHHTKLFAFIVLRACISFSSFTEYVCARWLLALVLVLPFAIDHLPDNRVESQLYRWRMLEAVNGLLERKKMEIVYAVESGIYNANTRKWWLITAEKMVYIFISFYFVFLFFIVCCVFFFGAHEKMTIDSLNKWVFFANCFQWFWVERVDGVLQGTNWINFSDARLSNIKQLSIRLEQA